MASNLQPIQPFVPFVDPATGVLTRDGYDYLRNLALVDVSTIEHLTISEGIVADGGGFKHVRVTTGLVAPGGVDVVVTWTTPFADTSYTVVAFVEDNITTGLRAGRLRTKTTTNATIRVLNDSAAGRTGVLHVIAVHD